MRQPYNHHLSQKGLGHEAPVQALKNWKMKVPDLFVENVRNHPGPDNYQTQRPLKKNFKILMNVAARCLIFFVNRNSLIDKPVTSAYPNFLP